MSFDFVPRRPSPRLAGIVHRIVWYRERSALPMVQRETAVLSVPLIVSLGGPFSIALGREPGAQDRQPSFAAGLFAGPVNIASAGDAACLQVDLSPLGAARLFGGALPELTARMVPLDAVLGRAGAALVEAAGNMAEEERFALVERFLAARLGPPPSATTRLAWHALARSRGTARIGAIATDAGVSRKHLSQTFAAEIGVPPKTVARMMRFAAARRAALEGGPGGWAAVAAEAGFADQAHLVREFQALAGETPAAWLRRAAGAGPGNSLPDDAW